MDLSKEWDHMMFAKGEDIYVSNNYEFVMIFVKYSIIRNIYEESYNTNQMIYLPLLLRIPS